MLHSYQRHLQSSPPLRLFLLLILFFTLHPSYAQKQITHQQQVWYKYYLKISFGPHWLFRQELDDRNFIRPYRQFQFLERTHLQRNLGNDWNVALGFAFSEVATPTDPNILTYFNVRELRPSFEIAHMDHLTTKWNLHQRFWNEFRFFKNSENKYVYSNMRLRYKLETHYIFSPWLTGLVFDEIFINLGKNIVVNTFDHNRFGLGLQLSFAKNLALEITYINWFQEKAIGYEYYSRDILKFALNHTISIHKKT